MIRSNSKILEIDKKISDNINKLEDERGLLASNILRFSKNFCEHIFPKNLYESSWQKKLKINYPNIQSSISFIKSKGELSQLRKFHKLLQISISHYSNSYDASERLILNYFEYFIVYKGL